MKKTFLLFIFLNISLLILAQNPINPNGYNTLYYRSGEKSGEGYLKSGKPVGFWKSYYQNGNLKTEGVWTENQLDSIWKFYDINGNIESEVTYKKGKRNGYVTYFKTYKDTSGFKSLKERTELFIDDKKYGEALYYNKEGRVVKLINYKDNFAHGYEKHFNDTGLLITIAKYRYGNIVEYEEINRTDKENKKDGVWKLFYENDRLKEYAEYKHGLLHGIFRTFDIKGKVIRNERYNDGQLVVDVKVEQNRETVKEQFNEDGTIKYSGKYIDSIPVGIHKEYNEKKEVIMNYIYSSKGELLSKGIFNKEGQKNGEWINYYKSSDIKSKGTYKDGVKTGKWIFFYSNGKQEQIGEYRNDKPHGHWKWFFENENPRREGYFKNGFEEGVFYELTDKGDTITKGKYIFGLKEGFWYEIVNDHIENGEYKEGERNGIWKYYYDDKKLEFEGNYNRGKEEGKHKYFHPNGTIKLISFYERGRKVKKWKKFDKNGNLVTQIEYKNDKVYKIDGLKIDD